MIIILSEHQILDIWSWHSILRYCKSCMIKCEMFHKDLLKVWAQPTQTVPYKKRVLRWTKEPLKNLMCLKPSKASKDHLNTEYFSKAIYSNSSFSSCKTWIKTNSREKDTDSEVRKSAHLQTHFKALFEHLRMNGLWIQVEDLKERHRHSRNNVHDTPLLKSN